MRLIAGIALALLLTLGSTATYAKERRKPPGRAWLGIGMGIATGSVKIPCSGGVSGECEEGGDPFRTYSANLTLAGPAALRIRGVRAKDDESNGRTPYEVAGLVGLRFGRSNWYGLIGAGRIRHPDDEFVGGEAEGFAWEIMFAPSSSSGAGFELSFQGNNGDEVEYTAFNLGMRFGALR